ncbi:MAG: hypothetical protein NTV15_00330 [Candidatus Bathyarchaeota archaeon]|nr:hypothetical protein [Candidatus Bathyarchaeota archaeon]
MSTHIFGTSGNDTIDRYPLPYEGDLRKLLCISKEAFKKLKAALDEFGIRPKPASVKPKTSLRQKTLKKEPLGYSKSDNLKPDRDKCIGSFEPSNIFNTRNSSLWRLRNLRAWFKEQESYEDLRYIKSYSTEI